MDQKQQYSCHWKRVIALKFSTMYYSWYFQDANEILMTLCNTLIMQPTSESTVLAASGECSKVQQF